MSPHNEHPDVTPGTVHLINVPELSASGVAVELVPRPSHDPEDPLNWSPQRKRTLAGMVLCYTMGIGFPLTLQYSVLADITADTGISTAALVQGTGLMFLFLGWGCLFWQPIALAYGRRGVYLISALATVPLMVWTAYTRTEGEWYAHRIIIGFFGACIESLPEVSIPDVFFAHDRGTWMSLYVFTLFGSNFLAPLCAGWFAEAFGWRWTMHFGAIMAAVTFFILFFFMEETIFFRTTLEGLEDTTDDTPEVPEKTTGSAKTDGPSSLESPAANLPVDAVATANSRPQNLLRMTPFRLLPERPSFGSVLKSMLLPLVIMAQFPTVVWSGFIYGINLSWYNVLNGTISPVLSAEPYGWSTGAVGSMYVGPIVGAAVACVWSGVVADRFTIYLAKKNKGIREPEHRLWPLAISSVLSCVGLIIWGVGAYYDIQWVGLAFGLGILTFACVTGGSIALSYNVDCFKDISGHSTTSIIVIRNTMGFAISYGITPWYTNMGLRYCFIMAGLLSLVCTGTFLLMIWKGKYFRQQSAKKYWGHVGVGKSNAIL
ncbi:major facilitator superfamily protein [Pestalotiopsis sp. NC0098]|nr:major facilitator superfamily protein [Pestalotiopsis sp. NC0098]